MKRVCNIIKNKIIFAMLLLVGAVALGVNLAFATGEESGEAYPRITLESIAQYGEEIAPVWDEYLYDSETEDFGAYYYPVANSSDAVTLGVMVDGLAEGETYRIFNNQEVTSEDNGKVIYSEVAPSVWMGDSVSCEGENESQNCEMWVNANEYYVSTYLEKTSNTWEYFGEVRATVRPAVVGSGDIEIVSVKQGGTDVVLDTVGRQVKDLYTLQTINEYHLMDYASPITIEYKLKNLNDGWQYHINFGYGESISFVANGEEKTGTTEVYLDATSKHTNIYVSLWGYMPNYSGSSDSSWHASNTTLYFSLDKSNFVPLGDIVVEELHQNGVLLNPTAVNSSDYQKEYTFDANDIQDLEVQLRALTATDDIKYYVGYYLNTDNYSTGVEWAEFSGAELKAGVTLNVLAEYGRSEDSPFELLFYIRTVENASSYNSKKFYYGEYDENRYSGDVININFYESTELPRYSVAYGYANYNDVDMLERYGAIDAKYHDAENPLKMRIDGVNYKDEQYYDVNIRVSKGDDLYERTFSASGYELNNGKEFVLDGLVLESPNYEFNWTMYVDEEEYEFVVEIDGVTKSESHYYSYATNSVMDSVVVYNDGTVNTERYGGGMGVGFYMSAYYTNMSRVALSSNGAKIYFVGSNLDDDVEYDYELYYDGNAEVEGDETERKITSGKITGEDLKDGKLNTDILSPGDADVVNYILVVKRDGKLVHVHWNRIEFWDDAGIKSIKVNADGEYVQTASNNYSVAKRSNMTVKLMGIGFSNWKKYEVTVSYDTLMASHGNTLADKGDTYEVTGAELNGGWTYTIEYEDAMADTPYVMVWFRISDDDGGDYPGHVMILGYVESNEIDEVSGYLVNSNTGEIERILPDEADEPEMTVDNRAMGVADVYVESDSLSVESKKACVVIGVKNGEYEKVLANSGASVGDGTMSYGYDISGYSEIMVALKGDGSLDGKVSSADSNMINRSLVSASLPAYKPLTDLQKVLLDLNGDGKVSSADSNIINRSLVSSGLSAYKEIQW